MCNVTGVEYVQAYAICRMNTQAVLDLFSQLAQGIACLSSNLPFTSFARPNKKYTHPGFYDSTCDNNLM